MLVKTQVVIYMYDELINNRHINMDQIMSEYEISVRTFRRYISEIQSYLFNFHKSKIVKYSMRDKCYYLADI